VVVAKEFVTTSMRKFKEKAREKVGEVKKKAEEKVLGLGDLRPTASTVEGDTTIWNVDKYVGIVQGQDKWSAAQLNISSTHINLSAQDRDTSIFLATDFDVRCVANSRQIDFNCKRGNYPRSQTIFFRIRARNEQQLTEITELANKNIESSRIQQEEKAREAQRQEEEKRAKAAEEYRRQYVYILVFFGLGLNSPNLVFAEKSRRMLRKGKHIFWSTERSVLAPIATQRVRATYGCAGIKDVCIRYA